MPGKVPIWLRRIRLTPPPPAARDATDNIQKKGTKGYKPGELEDLQSTAAYWDDPKLRDFPEGTPPGVMSNASLGMTFRADAAREKIPDAKKRKAAATSTLQQLLERIR